VLRKQDPDEFAGFVAGRHARLVRVAELLCGDRSRAEDLAQDGFARAYAAWGRIRAHDPEAYVRRWATEPVPGRHDQGDSDCWTRPDIPGEGHWLNLPTTSVAPHLGSANLAPWYGLAPPAASRVVLTFFGRTFTARPVRLPLPGGRTVSVFLVLTLVPGDGNAHWAASDISREVAYNRSGQIVASHGRWR